MAREVVCFICEENTGETEFIRVVALKRDLTIKPEKNYSAGTLNRDVIPDVPALTLPAFSHEVTDPALVDLVKRAFSKKFYELLPTVYFKEIIRLRSDNKKVCEELIQTIHDLEIALPFVA